MPFPQFDVGKVRLLPLAAREHEVDRGCFIYPDTASGNFCHPHLPALALAIVDARRQGASVIFFCGAHVLRQGCSPLLIDLMQRGIVTHLALNGAGAIHDFELALIGKTCESVARYISLGQFGLWQETGRINEAVAAGAREGLGFGEAVGRMIESEGFPFRHTSVLAAGYRLRVPVTVHVSIGQDIIHEHPNFDAAATGLASYRDFLILTHSVSGLEGGVFCSIGSAVAGPEVYLKALAMARNVAHRQGKQIARFTTAVFDIVELGEDLSTEAPKDDARYYFRPFKTILVRTIRDGGQSYYIRGQHRDAIPALYHQIMGTMKAR